MTQHPTSDRPIVDRPAATRKRAVRIAIAAIACIPLIYGGSLIWANQDPTHRLDKIPAAVVDLDQPVSQNGSHIDVGKTVAHDLVSDHENDNFDWTETDASSASAGLKNGTFLAEITLPKDLSANAASLGGNATDAADSQIKITTNDGQNFIVGIAAKTIGLTVAQNASTQVAQQYLSQIYSGLDQISGQLTNAASGAKQLASGATALKSGTAQLAAGAGQASSGAAQLASGLDTAQSGANQLTSGAARLAAGTAQLQTQTAAAANGAARLAAGNAKLAAGAKQLSTPLDQARALTSALPVPASQLAADGSALSSGLAQYADTASRLLSTCSSLSGPAAADAAVAQLCAQIDELAGPNGTSAAALTKDAQELGAGAAQLPQLVNGINQAADAADSLSSGAQQASSGANELADQLKSGESGAAELNSGAQQTAAGAQTLATKLQTATSGASSLASGTAKVASGADTLNSGAGSLATGAQTLASKLASGAASVPSYSNAQKSHLSNVAAQPIALAQTKLNSVPSYGYGLAPYFLALGAWVGGLSIYMLLRAIPLSSVERGRPGWLAALLGYLRGAWISLAQTALLYLVVTLGIGVRPAHPVGLALFLALTGVAFTAVNHALMVLFGSRGRFLGLILLVLQVSAAGATYPVQTTPAFFQFIHGLLPMTYAANAIRSLIAGGGAGVAQGVIVIACWGLVALLISIAVTTARRARRSAVLLPDFAV